MFVKLSDSIKNIKSKAFYYCDNLTSIDLSTNLKVIESSAFEDCKCLKEINLYDKLSIIEENAFRGSGLKKIVIPKSVKLIGKNCFYGCINLEEIYLPKHLFKFHLGIPKYTKVIKY